MSYFMDIILIKKLLQKNSFKNKIDLSYLYLLSVKIKSFINYFENDYINNYTHNYYGLPISLLKKIFKRNIVLDPPVPDSFNKLDQEIMILM